MAEGTKSIWSERQTKENKYILRNSVERRIKTGEELIMAFIYLGAAFNSIEKTHLEMFREN